MSGLIYYIYPILNSLFDIGFLALDSQKKNSQIPIDKNTIHYCTILGEKCARNKSDGRNATPLDRRKKFELFDFWGKGGSDD